jgi:hypothetical protein
MSNLEAARVALQAELDHAKTGHAFYVERIASLDKTLAQLSSLGGDVGDTTAKGPAPKAKRGRKPNSAKLAAAEQPAHSDSAAKPTKQAKRGKAGQRGRPRKEAAGTNELPFTGGDYWTDLVTSSPQLGQEILAAAISKLGFDPTEAQRKVLANRIAPALAALVKSGKIADSGKGRLHRYFKA